jgi:predicted permease
MANDLRYALRTLLKNPGFALVAVLTLALGIGANTAIFSVVNGVLLRALPFPQPERIVRVWTATAEERQSNHSAGDFQDLRREQQSLQAIAGYRNAVLTVVPRGGDGQQLNGAYVTAEFFDVLGVAAMEGRTFSHERDASQSERRVVLSHAARQRLFGEQKDIIGGPMRIDGQLHTVLGVLPPHAEWPAGALLWVLSGGDLPPMPVNLDRPPDDREVRYFDAIARLKPGVTIESAQLDLSRVAAIVQQRNLPTAAKRDFRIRELREEIVGNVRDGLLILQAAVGLVLLIACANVSSLLIARASGRHRELAVRTALGAGRGRLIRQLLTESLVLAGLGGFAGLLLGGWLTALLVRILPTTVPRIKEISLDATVTLVTVSAALLTGMLFGVLPALQASQVDALSSLKQGERGGTARARRFGRSALVVAEVALTLVLLAGAGLLLNSLLRLQRVESGFDPEHTTVVWIVLPQSRYPARAAQTGVYRRVIESLERRGEIQAVGVGFPGPLRGDNAGGSFTLEGRAGAPGDAVTRAYANIASVSGGYFRAMGIPLVSGRTFAESDREGAQRVAIVNLALARKYWAGGDPVGKRIRFDDDPKNPLTTIVGVVGDARQLGLHQDPPPIMYFPYEQFALPFTTVAVRSSAPAGTVASLVRAELAAIDPDLPPGSADPLQALLDRSLAQPRFRTTLLSAFAMIALALAAVGVYGLLSYSVAQRTREIGIRMALGAQPRQLLLRIMREGLVLAILGVAVGLAGALAAARVLATFVFGIGTADPATFASVALLLLAVACAASYVPSRRALKRDPLAALRAE